MNKSEDLCENNYCKDEEDIEMITDHNKTHTPFKWAIPTGI